mgnify:CR=1 FL=1
MFFSRLAFLQRAGEHGYHGWWWWLKGVQSLAPSLTHALTHESGHVDGGIRHPSPYIQAVPISQVVRAGTMGPVEVGRTKTCTHTTNTILPTHATQRIPPQGAISTQQQQERCSTHGRDRDTHHTTRADSHSKGWEGLDGERRFFSVLFSAGGGEPR